MKIKEQKRRTPKSLSLIHISLTDAVLEEKLFPKAPKVSPTKRMPDFDYIRKELMRNGVNKKLLWTEYLEECRLAGDEALM